MLRTGKWLKLALVLLPGVIVLGCGGGGGSTAPAGNASVGFYVGDSFGSNYSEVWTTIYHVDASTNGSTWTPIFDASSGTNVNLAALSSTVQFMGGMKMAPGNYAKVRITIADHMKLMATNGTVTNPPVSAPNGADVGGKYTFMVNMPTTVAPGQMANMALDFNLANFQMQGGVLQMDVQSMDPSRFNGMQHAGWLHGTVSNLTPGVSFTLSMGMGMMSGITVDLSTSTTITSLSTGQPTTLANGQVVSVQGTVDPSSQVVTAASVQVFDGGNSGPTYVGLRGAVQTVDATSLSFTVNSAWVSNFTPQGSAVTVKTDANTTFSKMMMGTATFSDVVAGGTVMVTGAYDSTSGTITANRVMIF